MCHRIATAVWVLVSIACFAAPGRAQENPPAPAGGTTYDVVFVFSDTSYTGTMTLTFDKDVVSGSMTITSPVPVTAKVAGTRKGTKLTFDYAYAMAGDQPCNGQVTIEATMDPKTGTASGTAHAVGCSDDPLDGTFSLTRAQGKGAGSGLQRAAQPAGWALDLAVPNPAVLR